MMEQKLQSKVQPREVSTTSTWRPRMRVALEDAGARGWAGGSRRLRGGAGRGAGCESTCRHLRCERPEMKCSRCLAFEGAGQFAEGDFALAAHDEVDGHRRDRLRCEAWVVASDDDLYARFEAADELHDALGGAALEGHDGQADEVGIDLADEAGDGLAYGALAEDEVGDGYFVVGVKVAGERGERAIGHADRDGGHVLEGVGHGEQKDVQGASWASSGRAVGRLCRWRTSYMRISFLEAI